MVGVNGGNIYDPIDPFIAWVLFKAGTYYPEKRTPNSRGQWQGESNGVLLPSVQPPGRSSNNVKNFLQA